MRDALISMVMQFASRGHADGTLFLSTGGLSALEEAFEALGWRDPHYVAEGGCEVADCPQWASCVGAYPRSRARDGVDPAMVGFGHLCGDHMFEWNLHDRPVPPDVGRLPSNSTCDD